VKRVRRAPNLFFLTASFAVFVLASACGGGDNGNDESNPFGLTSEVVTPAANVDAMAFAPDGRLFYAEHWTGNIRVVTADGQLLPDPFAHVDSAASVSLGLTGLALDPEFETNHYVYVLYSQLLDPGPPQGAKPVLARFTDSNNVGTDMTVLIGDLPEVNPQRVFNANGSLHFGPEGHLYFTLGDYDQAQNTGPNGQPLPQDLGSPIGKMLRVNKSDGLAPPDNPFVSDPTADPRIWAYGFRGAFNFTFHPQTERLYGTDSTGVTCEGVMIVERGGNYGWPTSVAFPFNDCNTGRPFLPIGYLTQEGRNPVDFDSTVGATGMEFISGEDYAVLGDSLVYCEARTQQLRRLVLAPPNFDSITANDLLARDCWLDVTVGLDGLLYYANLIEIRRLIPPTPAPVSPTGS
jgi:glucose/arabinose dehydrogenase